MNRFSCCNSNIYFAWVYRVWCLVPFISNVRVMIPDTMYFSHFVSTGKANLSREVQCLITFHTFLVCNPLRWCHQLDQGILNYDPDSPQWMNRDRFVLSMGHASMLLYGLLHVAGVKEMTQVH